MMLPDVKVGVDLRGVPEWVQIGETRLEGDCLSGLQLAWDARDGGRPVLSLVILAGSLETVRPE